MRYVASEYTFVGAEEDTYHWNYFQSVLNQQAKGMNFPNA